MRPKETQDLQRWREATRHGVAAAHGAADLFTDYLAAGGPAAVKSLQATVRKLQAQLQEQKADGRLERYRKLQKDLEECDRVRACLREALISCNWTHDEVDAHLQKNVFKANMLYGASREMLLRENRFLRAQLEEHIVTSRTSRRSGSPAAGRVTPPNSKLRQARMMQGPHMEVVAHLREAAEELDAAERSFRLPSVRHAEVQADDGSLKTIQTLEKQMATLAGQKLQLMQQVASMTEQNRVLDMKLEGALDQVSELRRQKTEMLAHSQNLSKDLREHLLAEAKRADTAEVALAEVKLSLAAAKEAETTALRSMERALAEAHAMQAALQEKAQEVDTLRGLYLELREALEKLAGDVTTGQQEAARRLLDATREQFLDQRALLEDVRGTTLETQRAAQQATEKATELAAQQRVLVTEVVKSGETAVVTLGAYERQLTITQQLLQQSEADRVRLARQAIAASLLNRMEGKRYQKATTLLLEQVPESVAQRMAPDLKALAAGTQQLADELDATNTALSEAGVVVGGPGRAQDMLHAPLVPDAVEDTTTQLLADSRQLRALLVNLAPGSPGFESEARATHGVVSHSNERNLQLYLPGQAAGHLGGGKPPVMELVAAGPVPAELAMAALNADSPAEAGGGGRSPIVELLVAPAPPGLPLGPPAAGPPPVIRQEEGLGPWLGPPALVLPNYAAIHPGPAHTSPTPMVQTRLPERLNMVLQLQRVDAASMASLHLLPPELPQQQHPEATQHYTAASSEPAVPAHEMAAAARASGGQDLGRGLASGDSRPVAADLPPNPAVREAAASGLRPVTEPSDPPPRQLDRTSERVEFERERYETTGAPVGSGGTGNQDGVIEQRLPATVWVPSPALLEAFQNIPV